MKLEYQGYSVSVRFVDGVYRGVLEGISDYVDFECIDLNDMESEFHRAVDDYIALCNEIKQSNKKQ